MAILFLKGTSASFKDPTFTPVADVFYMLTDTGDFYLGSRKLTSDQDLADAVQNIAANAADIAAIQATLAKLENDESTAGSIRNIIRGYIDGEIQQKLDKKVDKEIVGANGKALVFNESDGGGAKFEHKDGTWSFVGVNDGGENGLAAQIYAVKKVDDKYVGSRINVTRSGIYYTNGANSAAYTAGDELVTKKELTSGAEAKTVYLDDTASTSGTDYSKIYKLYQGADSSDMSHNTLVGTINIPKDMVVSSGSVKTVTVADEPYDGAEVGDKYIELVIANADQDKLYIPANSLVDVYTAQQNAPQIQLAIDPTTLVISAAIVAGSVGTTELADGAVTGAKLSNDAKALFDEAGAAADAKAELLGDPSDDADTVSLYGAIAKAQSMELMWGSFGE